MDYEIKIGFIRVIKKGGSGNEKKKLVHPTILREFKGLGVLQSGIRT
jgi:hypothetical protein